MKTRPLGRSGMNVTELCLGTMTWGHQNTEADAHAQMDYALGEGVTFWDTAEVYPVPIRPNLVNTTETYIGNWFTKTAQRNKVVLASKFGAKRPVLHEGADFGPALLHKALEGSLARLKTDYIDLYQLHWPSRPYPHHQNHWTFKPSDDTAREVELMHGLVQAMGEAVNAGKIRAWGLSNETPWGLMTYLNMAKALGVPGPVSVQNEYSLLYRMDDNYMEEVLTYEQVGLLPYSPLACGMLSGKYVGGERPEGTRWSIPNNGSDRRDTPRARLATQAYLDLAATHGLDSCQMALAWTLTRPFVASSIFGATTLEQLKTNIAAAKVVLSTEVLAGIEALRREFPQPY